MDITKIVMINFRLTYNEALWLKGLVQNPICYDRPENEPIEEKDMRFRFWDALKDLKGEGY